MPVEGFEDAKHDALLPLEPEGVDAVHQIDAQLWVIDGDLANAAETGVEVAVDLQRQRPVVERLRELAKGDLPAADEDDPLHFGKRGEEREAGRGIAGRSAGNAPRADHPRVREGGGHPVVFEAAAGIETLVLQQQLAGAHAQSPGEQVGLLQNRAPFADGDDIILSAIERQQLAEPPDAREVEATFRARPLGAPAVLEEIKVLGHRELGPVVLDVEQAAALRAGKMHVLDGVSGVAGGVDALLEGGFFHRSGECIRGA